MDDSRQCKKADRRQNKGGLLELNLVAGEYTFEFSHQNAFYTVSGDATVTLNAENTSHEIVFEESEEFESYTLRQE